MTDLKIVNTLDGGDLEQTGNDLETVSGVENTPYLAMFGGSDWVGNFLTDKPFNSKTEAVLNEVTLNSGGLMQIVDAMNSDLSYLSDIEGTVWTATATIIAPNRVKLSVTINGREFSYVWNPFDAESVPTVAGICPIVTGLASSDVTPTTLTFSWLATGAPSYEYAYNETGLPPVSWLPTPLTEVTITGLLSETEYFFFVRAKCADAFYSASVSNSETTASANPLWISPWLDPDVTNPSPGIFMEYGITEFSIFDGTADVDIPAIVLYTEAEEDAYLTFLNSGAFPTLTGTFSRTLGVFAYALGTGEGVATLPTALYKKMIYDVKVDIGLVDFGFTVTRASVSPAKMVIDYEDGNVVGYTNPAFGAQNITHSFDGVVSGDVKNVNVFHNDAISAIDFREDGVPYPATAEIVDVTGIAPLLIRVFGTRVCDQIATYSVDFTGCTLLKNIVFQNNYNMSDVPNIFLSPLPEFQSLFCDDNNFDSTETDRIINDFVANSWDGTTAISMRITNIPAAAPTAASLAARTAMITAGCTLTFDP
jgi:hypothetical protein